MFLTAITSGEGSLGARTCVPFLHRTGCYALLVDEVDDLWIAFVQAIEPAAERPAFGGEQRPHRGVRLVRRTEHTRCTGSADPGPEQRSANPATPVVIVNDEQLDEVAPEEVPRCHHDVADDVAALRDQTTMTRHRLIDESVPPDISATCQPVEMLDRLLVSLASEPNCDAPSGSSVHPRRARSRRT